MYEHFMRFEMEINPIPHGGTGKVNPIPHGDSGRNVPPYQEIVSLYFCQVQLQLQLIKKLFHFMIFDPLTYAIIKFRYRHEFYHKLGWVLTRLWCLKSKQFKLISNWLFLSRFDVSYF